MSNHGNDSINSDSNAEDVPTERLAATAIVELGTANENNSSPNDDESEDPSDKAQA